MESCGVEEVESTAGVARAVTREVSEQEVEANWGGSARNGAEERKGERAVCAKVELVWSEGV